MNGMARMAEEPCDCVCVNLLMHFSNCMLCMTADCITQNTIQFTLFSTLLFSTLYHDIPPTVDKMRWAPKFPLIKVCFFGSISMADVRKSKGMPKDANA